MSALKVHSHLQPDPAAADPLTSSLTHPSTEHLRTGFPDVAVPPDEHAHMYHLESPAQAHGSSLGPAPSRAGDLQAQQIPQAHAQSSAAPAASLDPTSYSAPSDTAGGHAQQSQHAGLAPTTPVPALAAILDTAAHHTAPLAGWSTQDSPQDDVPTQEHAHGFHESSPEPPAPPRTCLGPRLSALSVPSLRQQPPQEWLCPISWEVMLHPCTLVQTKQVQGTPRRALVRKSPIPLEAWNVFGT